MSTTVKADVAILEHAVKAYESTFEKLKNVTNILVSISFEPVPVSLMKQSVARGGNAFGLDPSDGPLVVVLFYTSWDKAGDDELVYGATKASLESIDKEAQVNGVSAEYSYVNYAFPGYNKPVASYGPEREAFLQKVGKKYDPDGFFQTAGVGPFKLK